MNVDRIRRLAPYACLSGILFAAIAVLVAVLGVFDLIRSIQELPKRFIYSAVMSLALSSSLGIAAFYSFTAWFQLRRLKETSDGESISRALDALAHFLRAFYLWVVLAAIV